MTPALSYLIPWFILFQRLGLANTYLALILTHLIIGLPLIIWIMVGFFEDVHRDLDDAAVIDGCSRFGSFLRVAIPLTRPGIAVSGILAFIFSWNNFIFAVVLAGPRLRTLPVAIFNVLTFEQINWGPLAAAALLVTAPVLVLAMMVQRHIITGLAAGGLKG
jgi:multiple sugar transport system permease protein